MTTTGTRFAVHRLAGRIGALVEGVDPAADLDDATITALTDALHEHKVLAFRGLDLGVAGQQRFARRFGELTAAHPTLPGRDGDAAVLAVDSTTGGRANIWHTDVTFVHAPPRISTLRSVLLPPHGGDTLFANTAAAYRDLPAPLRTLAEAADAVHTNHHDYVQPQFDTEARRAQQQVFRAARFETVHPVVRVHPETGERGLFVGGFAERVAGLSRAESADLLRLLQSYVTRPENTVRWRWQLGDLVVFDNRITQHYALDDYGDQPRLLHRVTVAGDVPTGIDGRRSRAVEGDASAYAPAAG